MDGTKVASETATQSERRRRWEPPSENVRYFLPKQGSSSATPELGQEMPTEGEALIKAFRDGCVFYTLIAWKAVPEMDSHGPKIVKQRVPRD
jgi:hypothetical protein